MDDCCNNGRSSYGSQKTGLQQGKAVLRLGSSEVLVESMSYQPLRSHRCRPVLHRRVTRMLESE